MAIVNPDTGAYRQAQIFVAVLGASNYTFACASWSQKQADWLNAHVKAFEYFSGVPELVVQDNILSGHRSICCLYYTISVFMLISKNIL